MHETKHTSFYISVKAALDKTLFFFLFAVPGVDPRPSIGPWQRAITSLSSCHACVGRKANRTLKPRECCKSTFCRYSREK